MSTLPDIPRNRLSPPARALAATLARAAGAAAWRVIHPALREPFLEPAANQPLTRLYYEACDGWRAPVYVLPPCPGGPGEPVLLAHALGVGADAYRYGARPSLASVLSAAGYAVYLLSHRGDRDALPPDRAVHTDFDAVVEADLPAALERVREHAGFERVHMVGHGLGGLLGLAWAGRTGAADLATLAVLCAPLRFDAPRSEARRLAVATRLVPAHWPVPARRLGHLLTPLVDDGLPLGPSGVYAGDRLRGVLARATEDVPVGLLRQVSSWLAAGRVTDRTGHVDYADLLVAARVPLRVVATGGDRLCPPSAAGVAAEAWGGDDVEVDLLPDDWGHLGPLVARDAQNRVFEPLAAWLEPRRRLAW